MVLGSLPTNFSSKDKASCEYAVPHPVIGRGNVNNESLFEGANKHSHPDLKDCNGFHASGK